MVDINICGVPMYLTEECGLTNLFLDIFIGIIRGNGLKVPLMLGHVLLNLEFQIDDEGLVLPVDHAVGDRETEKSNSDQGQAQQQEDPSLTVRHHGVSAEGEDAETAEHDAHQVEEDAQLARLGAPLWKLARGRGMKTGRGTFDIYPLVKWLDYVLDVVKKHC